MEKGVQAFVAPCQVCEQQEYNKTTKSTTKSVCPWSEFDHSVAPSVKMVVGDCFPKACKFVTFPKLPSVNLSSAYHSLNSIALKNAIL